ncbi:uncharacterized protein AKAW2_50179S [Aspergillus luchuensis]|uniref:Uncharacterized protein n=1 Tax=Aspergillus kawachii TaxID=1069201 RepID=A0A7R7WBC6_ASPKA|nr:uncharacterized protein AKAW2_50179S [Aspergillus luchuensis]BCR99837.1 hypothetical protein AKAW2_50179S [Aspergillus luchuensis]GAA93273.1 hypothetical protein AKAW_11385 [Aspergillus luchuensis IFO 4308]
MPWEGAMAALARVNPTIAQPAFRANDPIAAVRLKTSETSSVMCCSTAQHERHSTTTVNASASLLATNFHPPIISVSMECRPWRNFSRPFFRNSTVATSSAHSALWTSKSSPGTVGALPSARMTRAGPTVPTLAQTPSANSTILMGTGTQARGGSLSFLLAAVVLLSFLWLL